MLASVTSRAQPRKEFGMLGLDIWRQSTLWKCNTTTEFSECLSSSHLLDFGLPCTRSHACDWGAGGVVTIADWAWFTAEWGSAVCGSVGPSPSTSHRKQPQLTSPSLVSTCMSSLCKVAAVYNKVLERLMRIIQQLYCHAYWRVSVQDLKVLRGCYTGYHCQCKISSCIKYS